MKEATTTTTTTAIPIARWWLIGWVWLRPLSYSYCQGFQLPVYTVSVVEGSGWFFY